MFTKLSVKGLSLLVTEVNLLAAIMLALKGHYD